jgi:hypothetical protein
MPASNRQCRSRVRRGAVLLLATLTIAFAMVAGLTFLAGSSVALGLATIVEEHAQARQSAESAISATLEYMRLTPDWRDKHASGRWTDNLDIAGGRVELSVDYPGSAPVNDVLADPSFEQQTTTVSTPLLAPPMSATVGGWSFERSALVQTGATVPAMGTRASASATDGGNQAFTSFTASITGGVTISQVLSEELRPSTSYELTVDMEVSGIGPSASEAGFRVFAGSTLVASSSNAVTLADGLSADALSQTAQQVQGAAQAPSSLLATLLAGSTTQYALRFQTDAHPPAGSVRIELFSQATAVIRTVSFDNVRFTSQSNLPWSISASASAGGSTHRATASVRYDLSGTPRVVAWTEP